MLKVSANIERRALLFLVFFIPPLFQVLASDLYSPAEVVDSVYGISLFEKYNAQTGGESIRINDYGEPAENWVIDYYEDGTILHKGLYIQGNLVNYKNFYPDGTLERKFRPLAGGRHQMETFYETGLQRSKVVYFRQDPLEWNEFYPNGQLEFSEKFNSRFVLLYRNSYREDGTADILMQVKSKRKGIYEKKEYYDSGELKAEGKLIFNEGIFDYQREGIWTTYLADGRIASKGDYIHGKMNSEEVINVVPNQQPNVALDSEIQKSTSTMQTKNSINDIQPSESTTATVPITSGTMSVEDLAEEIDSFFDSKNENVKSASEIKEIIKDMDTVTP